VKLRKRLSKGKYYTYELTLPKKIIDALEWREGMELKVSIIIDEKTGVKGILITPKEQNL